MISGSWSNRPGGSPARQPSDLQVRRIPDHSRADLMTGVADQLRIEDARARPSGCIRREDSDHRPDPAAISGLAQVREAFGRDLVCGAHLPPVPDPQRAPVQPADAT